MSGPSAPGIPSGRESGLTPASSQLPPEKSHSPAPANCATTASASARSSRNRLWNCHSKPATQTITRPSAGREDRRRKYGPS